MRFEARTIWRRLIHFTLHGSAFVNSILRRYGVALSKEIAAELSRFGANIRRESTARNITQEKLAEKADLNICTVQKIEAGELNVLITTAARTSVRLAAGEIS